MEILFKVIRWSLRITVNVTSSFRRWDDYDQYHAAAYRQIVDFNDLGNSRFINVPGQSGDPESRHYDDLLERWQRVEYLPMRYDRKTVDGATHGRLELLP
jgi:penicillin amidase